MNGTAAADTMNGTAADDTINGLAGNDKIYGLAGNDLMNGGAGSDTIDGGAGSDTVSYADATAAVTINLAVAWAQWTGGSGSDKIINVENLTGSAFNDTLTGSAIANTLDGGDGNDTLNGGAGADTLLGGNGNDVLDGGADGDTMRGGDGNDIYYVDSASDIVDETVAAAAASASPDSVKSAVCACPFCAGGVTLHEGVSENAGTDKVITMVSFSLADSVHALGNIENLVLSGSAAINATGNALDNIISGNAGANLLDGGDGIDTLDFGGMIRAATVNLALTTAQATGYGNDTS